MSKVLVAGGAGYVGGHMVDAILAAGHEVRVTDTLLYEDAYLKPVPFFFADIRDRRAMKEHYLWADVVVFLAGMVGDPACALNPSRTHQVNVSAVEDLVADFGGRIIFPSTCSVYGAQDGLLTEDSQVNPLSLYAETKLVAEQILLDRAGESLIFRLGTLYGLSDTYARLRVDLVLNVLTIRAVLEGVMSVFGGQQYRPLLHVRDVATAAVPELETGSVGIFNLASENTTILDLAERIQRVQTASTIELTDLSFQDARNYRVSVLRAQNELGFRPNWSIEDGIREVAQAVQDKRIPNVGLPRFSNVLALGGPGR